MPRRAGPLESAFIALSRAWMSDAACAGLDDADMFFPAHSAYAGPAKSVCAGCPVEPQCLHHAITAKIDHGVWGGTSEAERKRLRRAGRRGWLEFPDPDTEEFEIPDDLSQL